MKFYDLGHKTSEIDFSLCGSGFVRMTPSGVSKISSAKRVNSAQGRVKDQLRPAS